MLDTQQTCAGIIFQSDEWSSTISWSKLLLLQQNVSNTYPDDCGAVCDPATCRPTTEGDGMLEFDEAAPRMLQSVAHLIPSVPFSYQRPYLKHLLHSDDIQHNDSLVFYNPSILTFTSAELPEAAFVVSFRGSVIEHPAIKEDMVGIAILDTDLKILRDVVVDPNSFMRAAYLDMHRSINFQDYRLSYLHGRIYLSDSQLLLPIEVHLSPANYTSNTNTLPAIFGGESLSITAPYGYHYLFQHDGKRLSGKNFALLEHGTKTYIELWPIPRTLMEVNLTNGVKFTYGAPEERRYNKTPLPSYASHEVKHISRKPFRFTSDRGTACCVTLEYKYFQDLLAANSNFSITGNVRVGISHAKSRVTLPDVGYGYLSRFYAVSERDPFFVVTMSALFCLSWHDGDWNDPFPNSHLAVESKFVYNCPAVHFPSGIALSRNDRVVVGYGIQDRQSRFVEYSKRELALHLFSPLPKND